MQTHYNLFESSQNALGTPQAIAAIKSISAFAHCRAPNGTYTTEIHSARGGRVHFKQVWAGRNPIEVIINQRGAWTRDSVTGETDPLDAPSIAMVRGHEFQMLPLTLAERYHNPQAPREMVWNTIPCFEIYATDDLGLPSVHYFRRDDLCWLGMELTSTHHPGKHILVVVRAWRVVENVLLPSHVSATDANGEYLLHFDDIRLNQAEADLFLPPLTAHQDAMAI